MMVKAHENCMSFFFFFFESFGFFVLYQMCKGGVKVQDFRSRTENQIFGVRATALIIQNNQIYLNRNENNQYYTIGGAICVNELSEDAVRREVMEEVGLSVEVERLAFVVENHFTQSDVQFHNIEFHYIVRPLEEPNSSMIEEGENRICEWVDLEELQNIDLVPHFLKEELQNLTDTVKHIRITEN